MRRLLLFSLLATLLMVSHDVLAQEGLALRASYQGQFLPDGTKLVVLAREAQRRENGRYQPEFFSVNQYPREARLVHGRDLIDDGFSSRRYSSTDRTGRLYFLYALTPDSTVYWSYSAQRDSLKFDVVSTGVMSVAPILADDLRADVLNTFFQPRVLVRMPGDGDGSDAIAARGDSLASDSTSQAVLDADLVSAEPIAAPEPRADLPPVASAALSATDEVSPPLIWIGLAALTLLGGFIYARRLKTEVRQLRLESIGLRERTVDADATMALRDEFEVVRQERNALRRELDELRRQRTDLLHDQAALQERLERLETELKRASSDPA